MPQIMLNIQDGRSTIHGFAQQNLGEVVIAALSADPETIGELQAAMARFMDGIESEGPLARLSEGVCLTSNEGGIWIVDLAARLICASSGKIIPPLSGYVAFHDGESPTDVQLPYHLADDWEVMTDFDDWPEQSQLRRKQRELPPSWNTREVLYDRVTEYLVQQCLQHAERNGTKSNPTAAIHARWLETPRTDLRDQAPRDVLLARQGEIDADLWDRCDQWSRLGVCPPGLNEDSAAYRNAGFGTHEIVTYYDLVRFLTKSCWDRIRQHPDTSAALEVQRLEKTRVYWLQSPHEDFYDMSPADVVASERRRVPLLVPRSELLIDDDCPLCRMMADNNQPTFWHLDDSHMDPDFAFSFYGTREEWESETGGAEAWDTDLPSASTPNGSESSRDLDPSPNSTSVWQCCYSNPDVMESLPASVLIPTLLFRLGACVAELTMDLKTDQRASAEATQLNRDFDRLREALQATEDYLLSSAVETFRDDLASAAETRPDLTAKCADLENQLLELQQHLGLV